MLVVCTRVSPTHVHVLSDQYAVTYMYSTACDSMHVCADTCPFMNMVCACMYDMAYGVLITYMNMCVHCMRTCVRMHHL